MVFGMTAASYAASHAGRMDHEHAHGHHGGIGGVGAAALGIVGGLGVTLWIVVMVVIGAIDLAMAVIPCYIAVKCNPKNPIGYGLLALIFSEIYLFQFLVRKFIVKEKGYCAGLC